MNERIKQIRKEFGLSQLEFGKRIGISDAAVSKIESGKNTPSEPTIKTIAHEFRISYEWIVYGKGHMKLDERPTADELIDRHMAGESEFAKSIMKAFAQLPANEWTMLMNLINEINEIREKEGRP